jgi:hypothetical protein
MSTKTLYSVNVIPDKEGEKFSPSFCKCKDCMIMHSTQLEWDTFTSKTKLQKRMMAVISKIETREKKGVISNKIKIPRKLKNIKTKKRKLRNNRS